MDAKLMVATHGGDDFNKLKGVVNKEDAMATAMSINPLLLLSARRGSWPALNVLLEREDAKDPPMTMLTQEFLELVGRIAARDVEEGASLAAGALLKGVTPDGGTALHAVASNGDGQGFLKYAGIIYGRDRGLLFAKNKKGDTPLHCAARAGNSKMVSHLIHLAAREGADTKLRLLRVQNKCHETALHEAIRFEDGTILGKKERAALLDAGEEREKDTIVKLLMGADPELANHPAHGVSPLYLAILLGKSTIALTLYDLSGGNLSYAGADGQNALHVSVLRHRDTGTH